MGTAVVDADLSSIDVSELVDRDGLDAAKPDKSDDLEALEIPVWLSSFLLVELEDCDCVGAVLLGGIAMVLTEARVVAREFKVVLDVGFKLVERD